MNISKVQVQITGEDILSMINDFVKVDGLNLSDVIIDKDIKVKGSFTKGVTVNFEAALDIIGVTDGKVQGEFSKFKIMKLGFFRPFRSFALKYGFKALEEFGVFADCDKDNMIIDVEKILKPIPFIKLEVSSVYINGQVVVAEVENINLSLKGELKEEVEVIEAEVIDEKDKVILPIKKIEDGYTVGREIVKEKIPEKVQKVSDYLLVVPDIVALIYRLLKDSRVPMKTKLSIAASVSYVLFPTDLIPDSIPFIGKIDEIAVVFFALNRIATDVEMQVILENWAGKNDLIYVLKNGLNYLVNFTGAKNVEKLYNVVEELSGL